MVIFFNILKTKSKKNLKKLGKFLSTGTFIKKIVENIWDITAKSWSNSRGMSRIFNLHLIFIHPIRNIFASLFCVTFRQWILHSQHFWNLHSKHMCWNAKFFKTTSYQVKSRGSRLTRSTFKRFSRDVVAARYQVIYTWHHVSYT